MTRSEPDHTGADMLSLVAGAMIISSSFGPQFGDDSSLEDLDGGCTAWTSCLGEMSSGFPDITGALPWLAGIGAAVAIVPPLIRIVLGRLRSSCAACGQFLGSFGVVLAMVAVLVMVPWQPRFVGHNESNHNFDLRPQWGIGLMLIGAVVGFAGRGACTRGSPTTVGGHGRARSRATGRLASRQTDQFVEVRVRSGPCGAIGNGTRPCSPVARRSMSLAECRIQSRWPMRYGRASVSMVEVGFSTSDAGPGR